MSQNLIAIVRSYKSFKRSNPDTWKLHCKNQRDLKSAISVAVMSTNQKNRKHPHQYRLSKITLETQREKLLLNEIKIKKVKDFNELLTLLSSFKVKGVGDLTAYDIAVRLGDFLGFEPEKIYLHAGPRKGAEKLLNRLLPSFVTQADLPPHLSKSSLTCYELEDLLCIYKSKF